MCVCSLSCSRIQNRLKNVCMRVLCVFVRVFARACVLGTVEWRSCFRLRAASNLLPSVLSTLLLSVAMHASVLYYSLLSVYEFGKGMSAALREGFVLSDLSIEN